MKKYLAFDIGGLSLKYSVYDIDRKEYENGIVEYDLMSKTEIWKNIYNIYEKLLKKYPILEIAIASSGIIDSDKNEIISIKESGAKYERLKISSLINSKVKVKVDNDARCALRAELSVNKDIENVILFTIGTALGSALAINGKILKGKNYLAGEIGCGYFDYHSSRNISESIGMYGLINRYEEITGSRISGKEIWEKFKNNEKNAEVVVNQQISSLAQLICNQSLFLNVNDIFIGGAISSNKLFIDELKKKVCFNYKKIGLPYNLNIRACYYKNDSGKIGALELYRG